MTTLTAGTLPSDLYSCGPVDGLRVSIIVPTFNRANYLVECIDSLLAQTMPALEIIVIDDGSEDGTAGVLQAYGERIRCIRKDNGGKPTAVNLGLAMARGELIWIFDDDDVALPNAISSRVAILQGSPNAGFAYSPHYYGRDGQNGKIEQGRLHELPNYNSDRFLFELMKGCFFHLATALVRADAYRTVGSFDTALLSSEDYDMQLRLARRFPAAYCSEPSFIFRQHDGLRGAKAIRYEGKQRVNVFRKFDQRVGLKLRDSIQLGDYLVPRRQAIDSDPSTQREALMARMTVMASKGCLTEMMEDLRSVLALLQDGELPTHSERQVVASAIGTGYAAGAIEDGWGDLRTVFATWSRSQAGRSVVRSMAFGMFSLAKGYPGSILDRLSRLKLAFLIFIYSI